MFKPVILTYIGIEEMTNSMSTEHKVIVGVLSVAAVVISMIISDRRQHKNKKDKEN